MTAVATEQTEAAIAALNLCLNKTVHSTAQYLLTTNPYTTDADKGALSIVKEIAQSDEALTTEILTLIEKLDGIPLQGGSNPAFAEWNYLSYPFLLDILIREHEIELAQLALAKASAAGQKEAEALVAKLHDSRAAQLKKLKDAREKNYKSES